MASCPVGTASTTKYITRVASRPVAQWPEEPAMAGDVGLVGDALGVAGTAVLTCLEHRLEGSVERLCEVLSLVVQMTYKIQMLARVVLGVEGLGLGLG